MCLYGKKTHNKKIIVDFIVLLCGGLGFFYWREVVCFVLLTFSINLTVVFKKNQILYASICIYKKKTQYIWKDNCSFFSFVRWWVFFIVVGCFVLLGFFFHNLIVVFKLVVKLVFFFNSGSAYIKFYIKYWTARFIVILKFKSSAVLVSYYREVTQCLHADWTTTCVRKTAMIK